ncbi:hypothetical protein N0V91_011239 [Didymella pomorum]|uniref:Uncharacterized protein n=1 Tax=Didymella pomorum TaxID=749634 RepID=A0A9W8YXZ1_9PLEO|nr:hypothetical protein N0V91_011239 [Didymella pomorum]
MPATLRAMCKSESDDEECVLVETTSGSLSEHAQPVTAPDDYGAATQNSTKRRRREKTIPELSTESLLDSDITAVDVIGDFHKLMPRLRPKNNPDVRTMLDEVAQTMATHTPSALPAFDKRDTGEKWLFTDLALARRFLEYHKRDHAMAPRIPTTPGLDMDEKHIVASVGSLDDPFCR